MWNGQEGSWQPQAGDNHPRQPARRQAGGAVQRHDQHQPGRQGGSHRSSTASRQARSTNYGGGRPQRRQHTPLLQTPMLPPAALLPPALPPSRAPPPAQHDNQPLTPQQNFYYQSGNYFQGYDDNFHNEYQQYPLNHGMAFQQQQQHHHEGPPLPGPHQQMYQPYNQQDHQRFNYRDQWDNPQWRWSNYNYPQVGFYQENTPNYDNYNPYHGQWQARNQYGQQHHPGGRAIVQSAHQHYQHHHHQQQQQQQLQQQQVFPADSVDRQRVGDVRIEHHQRKVYTSTETDVVYIDPVTNEKYTEIMQIVNDGITKVTTVPDESGPKDYNLGFNANEGKEGILKIKSEQESTHTQYHNSSQNELCIMPGSRQIKQEPQDSVKIKREPLDNEDMKSTFQQIKQEPPSDDRLRLWQIKQEPQTVYIKEEPQDNDLCFISSTTIQIPAQQLQQSFSSGSLNQIPHNNTSFPDEVVAVTTAQASLTAKMSTATASTTEMSIVSMRSTPTPNHADVNATGYRSLGNVMVTKATTQLQRMVRRSDGISDVLTVARAVASAPICIDDDDDDDDSLTVIEMTNQQVTQQAMLQQELEQQQHLEQQHLEQQQQQHLEQQHLEQQQQRLQQKEQQLLQQLQHHLRKQQHHQQFQPQQMLYQQQQQQRLQNQRPLQQLLQQQEYQPNCEQLESQKQDGRRGRKAQQQFQPAPETRQLRRTRQPQVRNCKRKKSGDETTSKKQENATLRDWSPGGGTQQQVSVVTTVWGLTTATQSGPHGGSVATGGGPGYGQQGPTAKQGSPFPGAYRQATPQGAAAGAECGRAGVVAHSRSHGQCWCVCCRGVVAPGAAGGGGGGYGPPQAAAAAAAGGGMSGVAGGGGGATPGGAQGTVAGGGAGQEAAGGPTQQYHPPPSALSAAAMVAAATATATATASVVAMQERQDMGQQFGQGSVPDFEDLLALDAVHC